VGLSEIIVDPITSVIYHLETRPSEGGRGVIVETEKDEGTDVFGKEWYARTLVQEYGGGVAVAYDGKIYFSNLKDSRVYQVNVKDDSPPTPVTPGEHKK
jgi:hypothetical protein